MNIDGYFKVITSLKTYLLILTQLKIGFWKLQKVFQTPLFITFQGIKMAWAPIFVSTFFG
jgi:hypothetical protein